MICLEDKTTQEATEEPPKIHFIDRFEIKYLDEAREFKAKIIGMKLRYLGEAWEFRAKIQEEREKYGKNNN